MHAVNTQKMSKLIAFTLDEFHEISWYYFFLFYGSAETCTNGTIKKFVLFINEEKDLTCESLMKKMYLMLEHCVTYTAIIKFLGLKIIFFVGFVLFLGYLNILIAKYENSF